MISNSKSKIIDEKCNLIPDGAILLKNYQDLLTKILFLKLLIFYKKNNIKVDISQWDLFHFHINNNEIVFHSMEYPKDIGNLGYCQKNSNVVSTNFNKRNLVYNIKENKLYFEENSKNKLYYDIESFEDRYIDPINLQTYLFSFKKNFNSKKILESFINLIM